MLRPPRPRAVQDADVAGTTIRGGEVGFAIAVEVRHCYGAEKTADGEAGSGAKAARPRPQEVVAMP